MDSVFIGIPTRDGRVSTYTMEALLVETTLLRQAGIRYELSYIPGYPFIAVARARLVADFMKSTYDSLLMIDDDVSWVAPGIMPLLEREEGVVGGQYPWKFRGDQTFMDVRLVDAANQHIIQNDMYAVWMLNGGFMRIRRHVFEHMFQAYPYKKFTDPINYFPTAECYGLFDEGVIDGVWSGEDVAFCRRWTNLGEQCWLYPNIKFIHMDGLKPLVGNIKEWFLANDNTNATVQCA